MSSPESSLPHDLPDLLGPDALIHPDVQALGGHNVNNVFRIGPRFVKVASRGGSPFAEVAAGKGMRLLGLNNLHPEYALHHGRHLVHAPFVEAKPLVRAGPDDVKGLSRDQIAATLFGEWLLGIDDRHSGNYLLHNGVTSIDHGHAFEPVFTGDFHGSRYARMPADHAAEMIRSVDPEESDLYSLARHHGKMSISQRVPEDALRAAYRHAPELMALAREGAAGTYPEVQDFAERALKDRLRALATHLKHEKHLTVKDLILLHHFVNAGKNSVTPQAQNGV